MPERTQIADRKRARSVRLDNLYGKIIPERKYNVFRRVVPES